MYGSQFLLGKKKNPTRGDNTGGAFSMATSSGKSKERKKKNPLRDTHYLCH